MFAFLAFSPRRSFWPSGTCSEDFLSSQSPDIYTELEKAVKTTYDLFCLREHSAEQKGKLLERAQHWPEPLAKQVARAARAAEGFRGWSNGFFAKMNRKWSTI